MAGEITMDDWNKFLERIRLIVELEGCTTVELKMALEVIHKVRATQGDANETSH